MKKLLCKVLDFWKASTDLRYKVGIFTTGLAVSYFVPAWLALIVIAALTAAEIGIYFYKK